MAQEEKFWGLRVFKEAHQLVLLVYRLTKAFPPDERYGLVPQMRRAVVSVVANIVEGSKRKSAKDRIHFHTTSDASLEELKYYVYLSKELGYLDESAYSNLLERCRTVGKMLFGLSRSLRSGG